MKRTCIFLITALQMLCAGCTAPKVSWDKAQDLFDAHRAENMNEMYYMGSDMRDHYLFHAFLTMHKTVYRVPKSELSITNEFPPTEDKTKWRKLPMPLRVSPEMKIESEQGVPGYRRQSAPQPEP